MINNTNNGGNDQTLFDQAVMDLVRARITHSGVASDYRDYSVGTGVTGIVKYASAALVDFLHAKGLNVPVTDSDIETALSTTIQLRCLQISRALPKGVFAGDVPIPDFFRPVVTALGMYEDPSRALVIRPVWNPAISGDLADGKAEGNKATTDEQYSTLVRVARVLKANGVRVTNGLPRSLETTHDDIFRIQETDEGELLVAGIDVSEVAVLVRAMLRLQFLGSVFGAARTRYLSVEDLRPTVEAIVSTAFAL